MERRAMLELELEAQRSRELLRRCGVREDELSKNAQLHVHVLSEAAAILQLRRPRTSALLAAASDLARSVDELEARAERLRTDEEAARDHARELQREWQDLQATRRQLDAAAEERERRENSVVMEQRTVEHEQAQRASEAELEALHLTLEDAGFEQLRGRMEHHNLHALDQECREIEAENRALEEELSATYHDLPLGKDEAAGALLQARLELQRLQDQFNLRIQQMI